MLVSTEGLEFGFELMYISAVVLFSSRLFGEVTGEAVS
jgi:hypothetical protein